MTDWNDIEEAGHKVVTMVTMFAASSISFQSVISFSG